MNLTNLTIAEYLDVLKSAAPAPGGGSASALTGAQGVALFLMVCELTLGKEKYAAHHDACREAKAAGETILRALTEAIQTDTDAFELVSAAYKMPKGTDEEKQARREAIAAATLKATEVPFSVTRLARDGLQAAAGLVGNSNPAAASDLGSAAANLLACARGAWLNVKINLPGVKDPEKSAYYSEQGQKLLADAEALAARLFEEIVEII